MLLPFSTPAIIAIGVLLAVYVFLISEKIPKTIVAILGAVALIVFQVFKSTEASSQENALHFVSHNLDILGFVVGMMVLVGIVRESGFFEAAAIWLVKLVRGQPVPLLIALSALTLIMTMFLSNIPTILILTPVVLVLIRQLKLPALPYLFAVVTMANLGGAATPISDPTTYYQAKTVGLSFLEVLSNSGLIVIVLAFVSTIYTLLVFRKQLAAVKVKVKDVDLFNPRQALQDRYILWVGVPIVVLSILLMIVKEPLAASTGITLDNASITLGAAFLAILLFHKEPQDILKRLIDWEIIFFFLGLFVVVGALEYTHVIGALAQGLVAITQGNQDALLFLIAVGSGILSTFIDNVPYNITMVGAIQAMAEKGIYVYPLWWALNLGTSIGGAGSPIAAACNVVAFGQAEEEGWHITFTKYLITALPLVVINAVITFAILAIRY